MKANALLLYVAIFHCFMTLPVLCDVNDRPQPSASFRLSRLAKCINDFSKASVGKTVPISGFRAAGTLYVLEWIKPSSDQLRLDNAISSNEATTKALEWTSTNVAKQVGAQRKTLVSITLVKTSSESDSWLWVADFEIQSSGRGVSSGTGFAPSLLVALSPAGNVLSVIKQGNGNPKSSEFKE